MTHVFSRRFCIAICALVVLAACASPQPRHAVAPRERRVVALVPSLTEDLFEIGAAPQVVAVSAFTDDVAQAKGLPRVADVTSIDVEKIIALHPDLVVGIRSQERLTAPLARAGIAVELMRDDTFGDLFTNIARLGALTGREGAARAVRMRLRRETAALRATTRSFTHHPTVFVLLDTSPIWTAGPSSYIGTLVTFAGGRTAAHISSAWGQYSEERLLDTQPDVLICDTDTHFEAVRDREPWRSLRAVRSGQVFIADKATANTLYRPGPRYNEALHWLIERLKPLST